MEKVYADALMNALERGEDEKQLVDGLVKHLERSGRVKLLPGILRELTAMEARKAKLLPTLEIASEKEKAVALAQAKEAGMEVKDTSINSNLIRGWRARSGSTLIDRSGKRALIELYRNIVTH